ncbi:tRNA (adenine(22)-N(1))-methyltransferase TrmK [Pseudoalteromonas luteoviolacea]|uniref:tRNA (adenine(22)-N(1))-methyltransferase n=1 Tax=Pseudoalteromonas luteoviolacea TaxID=43657 RepID=UPI001B36E7A2|nr:tRNA (adenine(22)-N(1))-methyltransferase TrmK [Pseudoalteromonas luteoviolacea]MBQ4811179.1 tRNA (adenine(22)-N(1))-methyltransferase TrmK [Pseudoalteromonas luteoviolacea]
MKLGKRLSHISDIVNNDYTHIWDCCCDHGLLGASLLDKELNAKIHFVDIVPHLIDALDEKLTQFYANKRERWQTYCQDVAALPLSQYSGKHLVIIAGVGGDLCSAFVQNIMRQNPSLNIDFILCPVHHLYTLRQTLQSLKLTLKSERLVNENKRSYELIYVSTDKLDGKPVHAVGQRIWCYQDKQEYEIAKHYLNKTIDHYQRINQGRDDVSDIIAAYRSVQLKSVE